MALPAVNDSFFPTPSELLNQMLSDVRFGAARRGIVANVEPGSELHERFTAVANRLSIAFENTRLALAAVNPLDASDADLESLASIYGITRRAASSATGFVQVTITGGPVAIPASYQCTAGSGIQYKTISSVVVSTGDFVEVEAVTAGSDTDLAAATVVTWDSASIGALTQTATVGAGGIDGGNDTDTDEVLRQRLIARLSFPASGGNNSQVIQLAEESTAAVEAAYVYQAVRGPSSYDVAVTKAGGDRTLSLATVNEIAGAVLAEMPGSADLNLTSVFAEQVDVVLDVSLPLPVNAGGAGGGWQDAKPWPSTAEAPGTFAKVTAVAVGLSQITVDSTTPDAPQVGQHFGIWNPSGGSSASGQMEEFVIAAVGGVSGAYVITVDSQQSSSLQFVEDLIVVGSNPYCSAGAANLKQYSEAYRDAIATVGPGEKSTSPDVLPRALRTPGGDFSNPSELTNLLLRSITDEHVEILDLLYAARFETGTSITKTAPSVPLTAMDEPRILTLKHLSIRRQV